MGDNGLIEQAKKTKNMTEESIESETKELNEAEKEYANYMATNKEIESLKTVADYKESGEIIKDTKKIYDEEGEEITVPGGFGIASDSAVEIDKGVVITDGTNEFVWIPVDDESLAEMYNTTTPETAPDIALSKSSLGEATTTTKLYSKLRIKSGNSNPAGLPNSIDAREPDILIDTSYGDAVPGDDTRGINLIKSVFGYTDSTNAGVLKHFAQDTVDEYTAVFNSIKEYNGFYIGRYELTGKMDNPTVKREEQILTADLSQAGNWYGLKKACSSIVNTNSAKSIMIYGNQWDEVVDWLVDTGAKSDSEVNIDSNTWGNYSNSSGAAAVEGAGEPQNAGHSDAWSANNIYDLAGNYYEWTQETNYTTNRLGHGRILRYFRS